MRIANGNDFAGSGAAAHAQSDLLLQQAQSEAGAGLGSGEKAKIAKAGSDFESILLGSWLQGAEKSFAAAPGGDADDDGQDGGGGEQFMGMAMQQLATSLVASGGIGIGKMITEHLGAASEPATHQGTATFRTDIGKN